ncbi:hypothetical protein E1B28_012995 [Marasmius oreades]|uniref:Hydrophobic surface binding protein A-domain-containing protein n=1 Tax=Marasmius oreades TaxID=181124 RepID=A0A9P7ULG3_9AGAR|nr:uncharacterized protein E1B28_012995 [Marasmius oreades]KAG7087017.1 hypothetical protein E1B28_012995 [Marasmius oreades]
MVRLFIPFVFLLSAASALATPLKRDVPTVKADIDNISTQVTNLDAKLTAFPDRGGSLKGALDIHQAAGTLDTSLKKGASDTQATPTPSEADSQAILASVEKFKPAILDALKVIVAKKPAFQALPLPGITAVVLQDLKTLSTDAGALADALIAKSPADLVDKANKIKSDLSSAFTTAIAAYS